MEIIRNEEFEIREAFKWLKGDNKGEHISAESIMGFLKENGVRSIKFEDLINLVKATSINFDKDLQYSEDEIKFESFYYFIYNSTILDQILKIS